jgi:D-amino peptidase
LLGAIETVAVKEGVSRSAARCLPVAQARAALEAAAERAVRRAASFAPFTFEGPVTAEVVFTDPSYADTLESLDFVERVDGRTIRVSAQDYFGAFERFNALHFLAPVVR